MFLAKDHSIPIKSDRVLYTLYADVSDAATPNQCRPSPARVKAARNIISSGGKYDPAHEPTSERTKVPWEVRRREASERAFEEDAAAAPRYPILSTRMI